MMMNRGQDDVPPSNNQPRRVEVTVSQAPYTGPEVIWLTVSPVPYNGPEVVFLTIDKPIAKPQKVLVTITNASDEQ